MPNRYVLLLLAAAIVAPLRAQPDDRGDQDQPIHMTPEFALTFPLASRGKDVTVKFPILINPSVAIQPGMVLRTLYVLSNDEGGASDLIVAHKANMEQAFSRDNSLPSQKMAPAVAHEIEGYRRTVWEVPTNFMLAMAQYPTDSMHLIFSTTGKDNDLDDERFSFFDGLMVGLPEGKVTVLAVEKESKAEAAGITAGDEILSVGGLPTQHNLGVFASAYSSAKKAAKEQEVSTYPMEIRSGSGTRTVHVAMPLRIKSGLMDGFGPNGP